MYLGLKKQKRANVIPTSFPPHSRPAGKELCPVTWSLESNMLPALILSQGHWGTNVQILQSSQILGLLP